MSVLVWTASGTARWLEGLDERLEIAEIPSDPLQDPRLDEVKILVPPLMRNLEDEAYDLAVAVATGELSDVPAIAAALRRPS